MRIQVQIATFRSLYHRSSNGFGAGSPNLLSQEIGEPTATQWRTGGFPA
jgi:hypothetical protein